MINCFSDSVLLFNCSASQKKYENSIEYQCLEYIQNILGSIIPMRSKLKISITNDQQIIYISQDGQIIRIDKINDQNHILLANIIQIKHLQWIGYSKNLKKIGYWVATLQGQALLGAGGYYSKDGKKQGDWSDLIWNYQDISNVYEIGIYNNDVRQGVWKYKYKKELINGGIYDQKGFKQGTWIDLGQQFWDFSQVTYEGQYKNGLKIGRWNINYREQNYKQFQIIGGGQYQNQGFKTNKWIELSNNFWDQSQVIYKGEYKKDLKVGLWEIFYGRNFAEIFQQIGLGLFDEQGQKNGYWIEPYFNFYQFCYVTYNGQYQNGKKIGQWLITYRRDHNKQQEIIGGGYYSNQGLKVGYWTDLSNCFYLYNQIIYQGYYRNGLKNGFWETKNRRDNIEYFERIGGGFYDEQGRKNGEWIDLTDNFYQYKFIHKIQYQIRNITYCGIYQNGQRIGKWEINHRNSIDKPNIIYGVGQYDENGFKNNKWIDLSDKFYLQITYNGEYQNGKKFGIWNTNYSRTIGEPPEKIGGGQYDDQMLKNGKWIELSDNFWEYCQVSFIGIYNNGQKFGQWNINYRENGQIKFNKIGGGIYQQQSLKDGEWVELSDHFQEDHQVVYIGEYKTGLKFGRWNTLYRKNSENLFQHIGGGSYDNYGLQKGKWIELSQNFQENLQIFYKGEFIKGYKIGLWDTIYRKKEDGQLQLIEYGLYDYIGQKNGKWVELNFDFQEDNQVICIGEYKKDQKIGKWKMKQREMHEGFEKIGEQYQY
ncbi:unnamed protein product [Paramecium pentaurelia]|uniref:Uncharacterized protein n=1 Tax=Paramecium pentaurelia TaxID=43138 RepID=A0A8S1S457_9CILI|nr:unnamed protein product [Paramecium pentaurelia]